MHRFGRLTFSRWTQLFTCQRGRRGRASSSRLSLPPFLVAGERIDPTRALSNDEGKHLVQFLKFPTIHCAISVRVRSGGTIRSILRLRIRRCVQIPSRTRTRYADAANPDLRWRCLWLHRLEPLPKGPGCGDKGCPGRPDIVDQHPNSDPLGLFTLAGAVWSVCPGKPADIRFEGIADIGRPRGR